jgi:hypothetical protein
MTMLELSESAETFDSALECPDLSELFDGATRRAAVSDVSPTGESGDESPHSKLRFESLEAFRPIVERAPDVQVAEAQRREFFAQLHRWLRQGYAVHVFCNTEGERQRFEEIWHDLVGQAPPLPKLRARALARP